MLRHPDLSKVFYVGNDASDVDIGGLLSQDGHLITYFSEKLDEAKQCYSIYDEDFYVVVQFFCHWRYYLLPKEFSLYSDHEVLRYLHFQSKLTSRHVKWVEFLQNYTFILKYCSRVDNKVADALSHVFTILHTIKNSIVDFESLRNEYSQCPDFDNIYTESQITLVLHKVSFFLEMGIFLKVLSYVFPLLTLRDFLVQELHAEGLAGHFARDKTIALVEDRFYWLKRDVACIMSLFLLVNWISLINETLVCTLPFLCHIPLGLILT